MGCGELGHGESVQDQDQGSGNIVVVSGGAVVTGAKAGVGAGAKAGVVGTGSE